MIECTDCGSKSVAHECPATSPTPNPLRAALQGLADEFRNLAAMHGAGADKHVVGDSDDYAMGLDRGRQIAYSSAEEALRAVLAAHPEPEREARAWNLDAAFGEAVAWLDDLAATGPDLTVKAHLKAVHEAQELAESPTREEWADVAICLAGVAMQNGWSPAQLSRSMVAKVEKNRGRTWQQAPDGTWQHTPPVAHQSAWREGLCHTCAGKPIHPQCPECRTRPPVPETDEAAALAEVIDREYVAATGNGFAPECKPAPLALARVLLALGYRKQADR